jgi:hypothetical protein
VLRPLAELLELPPEAWLASALLREPGARQAVSQAGPAFAQRVAWPEASDAHRVRGARHPGVHDARRRPVLRDARDEQQQAESVQPAAQRVAPALRREAWAELDVAAAQLQGPDAPQGAQVVPRAARLAARHVARELRPEVQGEPDVGLVARRQEAQLQAERAVARQPAAAPSAQPWARLLLQAGLPVRAGSAHRHSMREMSRLRSASHRTQSWPAGRDEVLS